MTSARIACIDIGSNTTRLLVADCDDRRLTEVAAVRAFTHLGAGCGPGDPLHGDRIAAVVAAVGEQLGHAQRLGAGTVALVATSAVRSAPNGALLEAAVLEAHGRVVRVLTGEEEAAYAFAGATATLRGVAADTVVGVVDVGGGSTELVLGTLAAGPTWSVSLAIGSARLPRCADPPGEDELAELERLVDAHFRAVSPPTVPALALAVGGSATSVTRLVGTELSPGALAAALALLRTAPGPELARTHLLDERRIALLPAGLTLLGAASSVLRAPLRVAGGGLREGVLLDIARSG